MRIIDPRERLRALAEQRRTTLTDLSRVIGQRPRYLSRFVREGVPAALEPEERKTLCTFFGVAETELGGQDPRWSKFKGARA